MQPRFDQNTYQASASAARLPAAVQPDQLAWDQHTVCLPPLPALPLTLAEMELLLQGPVVDLRAIAEVAKRDASLTALLLLLANRDREEGDRFYRIEDCLVQLGITVLQELVRQTPPLSPSDWRCGTLLDHSRQTALAAEVIALKFPGVDPEKAYLAGLLHLFPELVSAASRVTENSGAFSGESAEWPLPAFAWDVICGFRYPCAVSGQARALCEVVLVACEWIRLATLKPMAESPVQPNSHLTKAP
jgi:hypothetical protein